MGRNDLSQLLEPDVAPTSLPLGEPKLRQDAGCDESLYPSPLAGRSDSVGPPARAGTGPLQMGQTPASLAAFVEGRPGALPWGGFAMALAAAALLVVLRPPDVILFLLLVWMLLFCLALLTAN